jgi:hypothetical protein
MNSAPLGTARDADESRLRDATLATFQQVAEEVAARIDMPEAHKVKILLAFVRALSALQRPNIRNIDDVDRLILTDPDAFERLLSAYWLLLGARRRAL